MVRLALALVAVLALLATSCTRLPQRRIEFVEPPPSGDVAAFVTAELERARRDGHSVLVYVGASWCEPCKRFHHAVETGQLDGRLPNLRLLDFDRDRDGDRLAAAGYTSHYIPLFARPRPDGRSSQEQIEGSVKGDGAVAEITPRLKALLSN